MQKLVLALCLTVAASYQVEFSSDNEFELPKFYHTTPQMVGEVNKLASTCKALTVETMKDGEREIQVARYKDTSVGMMGPKYKTMVVAGEHARELIGTEIALNFVKALCGQAASSDIAEAAKETEFLVVMNANPGSRVLVENGEYCRRVSPGNVDINRNFDVQYDQVDRGDADTNPGEHAFDQPESRILKKLMETFQPHAYLDLHSGFKGMFFPNKVANDKALSTKLQRLVAPVDESTCNCPLGVANEAVGYHTAGSALDYSFAVVNVPFSMAVEVFIGKPRDAKELEDRWNAQKGDLLKPEAKGSSFLENGDTTIPMSVIETPVDMATNPKQCLHNFNPLKQTVFNNILDKWTNALAQLSIKSREIKANAAVEALRKTPGMSFRQKIEEPQQEVPVWIALKALGLLLVVYVGMKYYSVKQSKSAEAAPLTAQMTTLQVSD